MLNARREGVARDSGGVDLDQLPGPIGEVAIGDEPGLADQPAAVVDVEHLRVAGRFGSIDRRVDAVVEHKAVGPVVGVEIGARDLAFVVDAVGSGGVEAGVGVGDGREASVGVAHEGADRGLLRIDGVAHDPTPIVDI